MHQARAKHGEDSRGAKAGQWGRATEVEVEALAKLAEALEQERGLRLLAITVGVAWSTLRIGRRARRGSTWTSRWWSSPSVRPG